MRVLVLHSRYLSGAASGENRVVEDEVDLLRGAGIEVESWTPEVQEGVRQDRIGRRMVACGTGPRCVIGPGRSHRMSSTSTVSSPPLTRDPRRNRWCPDRRDATQLQTPLPTRDVPPSRGCM